MATRFLTLVLFVLAVVASSALTVIYLDKSNKGNVAGVDEDTIKKVISEFIQEKPEVIVEALRSAQVKQERQDAVEAEKNVAQVRSQLEANEPIVGKASDKVSMVVFHDYNCGFCRKVIPTIDQLIAENDDMKVILVDMPILGPTSEQKARISLAVGHVAPKKHYDFYKELSNKNPRTLEQMKAIVSDLGVDVAEVVKAMDSPKVSNKIAENKSIAQRVGIRGTPAFIINGKLVKGAVGIEKFREAILDAKS